MTKLNNMHLQFHIFGEKLQITNERTSRAVTCRAVTGVTVGQTRVAVGLGSTARGGLRRAVVVCDARRRSERAGEARKQKANNSNQRGDTQSVTICVIACLTVTYRVGLRSCVAPAYV